MNTPLSGNNPVTVTSGVPLDDGRQHYVGQFVLAPAFVENFAARRKIDGDGVWKLSAHPELACTQVTDGRRSLTLIGHMLDPLAPGSGNEDILRLLLGRFTDALGLRQVFYTDLHETGALWAMSQPGIAAESLGLRLDPQAAAFMASHAFRSHPEYRWPGEASPFGGIRHLLPNRYLDLNTGTSRRYWPVRPVAAFEPDAAIERLSVLLPGLIRAAAQRFDLALALTAGLDSRLVLAAAKEVRDRVSFVICGRTETHSVSSFGTNSSSTITSRCFERSGRCVQRPGHPLPRHIFPSILKVVPVRRVTNGPMRSRTV